MLTRAFFIAFAGLYAVSAAAAEAPGTGAPAPASGQIEVSADKSLEWYQDKHIYVARGNAKAVRGDMTVTADLLTAHERPQAKDGKAKDSGAPGAAQGGGGDIDRMTADGNVVITRPGTRVTGEHAVDDMDAHVMTLTGGNLRYESAKQAVTAKDSLEYWDEKKMAVARGNAVAVQDGRHIEGDVLSAWFRDQPNGQSQLYKMTADGHVTVITGSDIARGDKAVYNVASGVAVLNGHVRITRNDGTQLSGDVGESNFRTNESRLLNNGSGRVRALLPAHDSGKPAAPAAAGGAS